MAHDFSRRRLMRDGDSPSVVVRSASPNSSMKPTRRFVPPLRTISHENKAGRLVYSHIYGQISVIDAS